MDKINFEDGVTKVNAETFSEFQDNIEKAIDEVVESGSNENGNYIKYADGTMICTKTVTATGTQFNYTEGSLYFCPRISLGDTPQTFTSVQAVHLNVSSGYGLVSGAHEYTNTSFGITQLFRGDNTPQDLTMQVTAIGRWK